MFDRAKYKRFARTQLKNRWKIPVLATLVTNAIICILNAPGTYKTIQSLLQYASDMNIQSYILRSETNSTGDILQMFSIFINFVLIMAQIKLYLKMSKSPEPVTFSNFIEGFSLWARGILSFLWMILWTTLWSMLFIIPGIIKQLSYSQTPYLTAEYPSLSVRKAMKVSMEITKGHKTDIFIAQLSFIGWYILNVLTFGILSLWLTPYYIMTMTNIYHALLKEALEKKTILPEDLAG